MKKLKPKTGASKAAKGPADPIQIESYSITTFPGDGNIQSGSLTVDKAIAVITCRGKKIGGKFTSLELWFSSRGAAINPSQYYEDAKYMVGRLFYDEAAFGGMVQTASAKKAYIVIAQSPIKFYGIIANS